eukprot:jgi/Picsp_1/3363/NSC_06201-R1_peroxisomal nadh pyrophosphatase nudt12
MDNLTRELMSFRGAKLFRDLPRDFSWAQAFKENKLLFILVSNRDILIQTKNCSAFHPENTLTRVGHFETKDDVSAEFCISESLFCVSKISMPTYYLGRKGDEGTIVAAIDATKLHDCSSAGTALDKLKEEIGATSLALRSLALGKEGGQHDDVDVTAAGIAVALCQWHRDHVFCCKCGSVTQPVRLGTRRICVSNPSHKHYPRTDPVVIMLVIHPSGQRVLLGRSKKNPPGMYTCLSGFMDQGESIADAVRREVLEESNIQVKDIIEVFDSQPWPIGRGGSCELMIGCFAFAITDEIRVCPEEMDDCCWVDADTLHAVLLKHHDRHGLQQKATQFSVPPPGAIAHQLMLHWLKNYNEHRNKCLM